jgi:succinoglycan biosynthesis transport protein ExoP
MYSDTPQTPGIPPGTRLRRVEELRAAQAVPRLVPAARPAKPPPAIVSAPLGIRGLLRGLRRHWGIAVALGLLLALPAAAGTWFLATGARYSDQAMLHVEATPPTFVFKTSDTSAEERSEFTTYQQTQATLIKSRFVLGAALRHPDIARLRCVVEQDDPVAWLAEKLSISFTGEVMSVGLQLDDRQAVVKLINAVTDAYLNEVVNVERNRRMERHSKLRELYADYTKSLNNRRETLRKLAEAAGSNDKETLAFKQQLAIERHAAAENELRRLRAQMRDARMELDVLGPAPRPESQPQPAAAPGPGKELEAALDAAIARDATVQRHQARIAELQRLIDQYRRVARNAADPAIRATRAELASTRAALEQHRAQLRKLLLDQYEAERQPRPEEGPAAPDDRELLARRLKVLEQYEKDLADEVAKLEKGVHSFNVTALDWETTRDELQYSERAAERIGQEAEALKVELEAPSRIWLIEKAEVPRDLGSKRRILASAAAGSGIFGLVLFGFAWFAARGRHVMAVDEVVYGLGMDLVGVLPRMPGRRPRALAGPSPAPADPWQDLLLESVDATRAMLLHALRTESIQVVMVASAQTGEGKTSLACHLATSLARARRRTLLVDCDLRCPSAHVLFDQPLAPGVCEVLRGEVELADAIVPTMAAGLSLLPAGSSDASAIDALAQGNLQGLLDQLREQFDSIILDSAPILAVADTLQICQHADAVLFSVLRDVSRLPKIHAAYERLARLGVRILGAVVAGAQVEDYNAMYSYSYAYGRRGPAPGSGPPRARD